MSKSNRFKEAFQENFNLVGLAGAAALSMAIVNPIPLLVGLVVEAAYLLFVPDSKWYETRLSVRFDSQVVERRNRLKAQVFPTISKRQQDRFLRLEAIRGQIVAQPGVEKEHWFREVLRKLDYLLEKFLLFGQKETQFRTYLHSVYEEVVASNLPSGKRDRNKDKDRERDQDNRRGWVADLQDDDVQIRIVAGRGGSYRGTGDQQRSSGTPPEGAPRVNERWVQETVLAIQGHYDEEIARIRTTREKEEEYNTQAILDKRIEVLEQRKEYVSKIGRILTNLGHQMELLEDSFGLINDQLRARSPEQVLADIEGVVYQTDSMTKLLDELAPYEEMSQRLAA